MKEKKVKVHTKIENMPKLEGTLKKKKKKKGQRDKELKIRSYVKKKAAHIFIQFQTPPPSGLSGGFVISEHGVNGEYIDKD